MKTKSKTKNRKSDCGFQFRDRLLYGDGVRLTDVASQFGTPCYVYSRQRLAEAYREYDLAFGDVAHIVCYAVKANPANSILTAMAELNAGFDIVSGGELAQVQRAGGDPKRIIFSGVGKMDAEINAGLDAGIRSFNIESPSELRRLDKLAQQKKCRATVAFRVNPGVAADTHPHIATGGREHKFGISLQQIPGLVGVAQGMSGITLQGLAMHIGSQMTRLQPVVEAATHLRELADELRAGGVGIRYLDLGGGLGVGADAPAIADYVAALKDVFSDTDAYELAIEPGRSITASAGILLTRVVNIKHGETKSFAIVDCGMNDLLRPALYDAHHDIINIDTTRPSITGTYDIVGPVCESADTLGKRRRLALREGSVLAVMDTGAYGATMSSHYNSRPRCAEVMVDQGVARLTRQRETIKELSRHEMFMTKKDQ